MSLGAGRVAENKEAGILGAERREHARLRGLDVEGTADPRWKNCKFFKSLGVNRLAALVQLAEREGLKSVREKAEPNFITGSQREAPEVPANGFKRCLPEC